MYVVYVKFLAVVKFLLRTLLYFNILYLLFSQINIIMNNILAEMSGYTLGKCALTGCAPEKNIYIKENRNVISRSSNI